MPFDQAAPKELVAVQTFGDYLKFYPHLHIIATDGCLYDQTGFMVGSETDPEAVELAFRLEVLSCLKRRQDLGCRYRQYSGVAEQWV